MKSNCLFFLPGLLINIMEVWQSGLRCIIVSRNLESVGWPRKPLVEKIIYALSGFVCLRL